MKRTCSGCKALDAARKYPCELGYAVVQTGLWPHYRYTPDEECPKPLTIKEWMRLATEQKSTKAEV